MTKDDVKRFLENLTDEQEAAALYSAMAEIEKQPQLAEVYRRMSEVEAGHAEFWRSKIEAETGNIPKVAIGWRTRALIWLTRKFGTGVALQTAVAREKDGSAGYAGQPEKEASLFSVQEDSHKRLLNTVANLNAGGMQGGLLAQMEGKHRSGGGNALRAAVMGANDGLVSNLSLVMGVAGAAMDGKAILITGLAGLLAGAISMALGEWLSVQSSRELYQHQIAIEERELALAPEEEAQELALIYQAKGLDADQAAKLANQIVSDPSIALDTLAREELGIDPEELGGSAWEAAITSFLLFAIGAIIPVSPFIFTSGFEAVIYSLVLSALGLFILGAAITILTGRSAFASGFRQALFGMVAAAITYGIGHLIGVSISG
ncbi:MAG: VIT1/CCC1 transporter family protein [Anaerolineaceae bacterium]|nr:VIT1/CCC1 transporter family protein [Anaerolineaceae bacterium]MBN2676480.1 VIT1/CCC1 transporter family protein [Anaerolineaceae bacterium]